MNGLTQYGNAGIFYNTHIFSEELVAEFLAPPKPPTSAPTPVPVPLGIKTPDEAFALAWNEMVKEEEFVKAIEEGQYTSAQFLSNFKEQRSTPLTPEELGRMEESILTDYRQTIEKGGFGHRIGGELVFFIRKDQPNSESLSANVEAWINFAFVVIDCILIISAAAGVYLYVKKQSVMKELGKSLWSRVKDFFTHGFRNEIADLVKKKNYLELLIKIMQLLNAVGIDFKGVVKAVVKDMGYLQWVLLGVSLLASVLLFIASLGVSVAFQVAALTALFLVLCIDVVNLIYSLNDSEFSLSAGGA